MYGSQKVILSCSIKGVHCPPHFSMALKRPTTSIKLLHSYHNKSKLNIVYVYTQVK